MRVELEPSPGGAAGASASSGGGWRRMSKRVSDSGESAASSERRRRRLRHESATFGDDSTEQPTISPSIRSSGARNGAAHRWQSPPKRPVPRGGAHSSGRDFMSVLFAAAAACGPTAQRPAPGTEQCQARRRGGRSDSVPSLRMSRLCTIRDCRRTVVRPGAISLPPWLAQPRNPSRPPRPQPRVRPNLLIGFRALTSVIFSFHCVLFGSID